MHPRFPPQILPHTPGLSPSPEPGALNFPWLAAQKRCGCTFPAQLIPFVSWLLPKRLLRIPSNAAEKSICRHEAARRGILISHLLEDDKARARGKIDRPQKRFRSPN